LEEKFIDGALVVGKEGWMPVVSVARTKEQIIDAGGTKYGAVPVLKGLKPAIGEHGLSRIALVGSSCHIQSARYLQHSGSPLASILKFTVGVFCRENYEYKCMEEKVIELGLKPEEVDKFEISEEFNIWAKGKRFSYPITVAKTWVPRHCLICEDFANELADISVGSDGSPEGWSTVVIRSEEAETVFSRIERNKAIETKPLETVDHIRQFANRKREKGKQTREIFNLREKGLERKEIAAKLGITEERVSHRLEKF
jgi:coenzyme F420 hydrogenase subunit beta